ncbi:MAG: glycine--tRNA ligase subunit beta [Ignavibacteriales bacterium]
MRLYDLLVEVGFEEMPAAFLPSAVEQLRERTTVMLDELRLRPAVADGRAAHGGAADCGAAGGGAAPRVRVYATPRRLALLCTGIPEAQEDRTSEARGPSRAVAFDAEGKFTKAALGFARGQGVNPEDLVVRATPAGEYVYAVKVEKGRNAFAVLSEAIPPVVMSLTFPRTMRWGHGEHSFARPIRWVMALLGDRVLDFELAGVRSGRFTYGHRVLGPGPFEIPEPGRYVSILREAGVIVDQDERRDLIRRQVEAVAAEEGGVAVIDPALLEQVTHLVEYPTAFAGRFSEDYLEIPAEVLITTMRHHQRYFHVEAAGGARLLLPCFVSVRNGGLDHLDQVRKGNERVIRARLADASFFFKEDQKVRLEDRVDLLRRVLFQENLGTLHDKTERIRALARKIGEMAGLDERRVALIDRAALLCKADLTTGMVREFPELQGVMGREYARRQGEDTEVCLAISEHYMPAQSRGELPATMTGAVLSVADKIDTISGCFLAGIIPSGSQDPYALRRQGSGVVSILAGDASGDIRLSLGATVETALALLEGQRPGLGEGSDGKADILDFLKGRLKGYLEDAGVKYDVVDAVLEAGFDDVGSAVKRACALQAFSAEPDFPVMMVGFKRAANLAREARTAEVNEGLLGEAEEKALHEQFKCTRVEAERLLAGEDYAGFFRCMARLKEPVDAFLDKVLVMCEDLDVRRNRLALLSNVAGLFGRAADLSRLVVS